MAEPTFSHQLTGEFGFSHREFFRLLPAAVAHRPFQVDGKHIEIAWEDRLVVIELGAETVRRLALLELPVTTITLSFYNFGDAEMQAFMDRFKLYLQRGGG